jgi:hypothetical protein
MSDERDLAPDDAGLDDLDDLLGLEPEPEDAALDEQPAAEDHGEPVEPPAPRPPSRSKQRFDLLRSRLKEQEDENRKLRDAFLRSTQMPQQQTPVDPYRNAEMQRLESERVASMMPHEQAQYYAQQSEQRMSNQLARARLEVGDILDRQNFAQIQREEPMARRWADDVEQMLSMARQQGQNPTREALYQQLLAQHVRERSKKEGERQRRNGRAAIQRQTTQPGNGRSTVAPARRGQGDDYEAVVDRLRNTRLGDVW